MNRARRRDRRVYLASHPVLLALLAATRRVPVLRIGRTVLVNRAAEFHEALTRLPMDRLAAGTTGAVARELVSDGLLFDQDGPEHRGTRRSINLSAACVEQLRPVWQAVLDRSVESLAHGADVDIVDVARELAGATVIALLGLNCDPFRVADAAQDVAAASAKHHLAGRRPISSGRTTGQEAEAATARLTDLVTGGRAEPALAAMLAVTAVNTTVAGLPRAVAWCADAKLWSQAVDDDQCEVLVAELVRAVVAVPLLTRVAGADGTVGRCRVRKGDRLLLVTRHATDAQRIDPDCVRPAPAHVRQLAFGAGLHACPGARLARAQLTDTLHALAAYRPVVVRALADRRAALPGWRSLVVHAGGPG
jgi:cytochrome P450